LAAQAVALGVLGVTGLIGVLVRPHADGWRLLGVPLTPALSAVLLVIAGAATLGSAHRGSAKVFTLAVSAIAVTLMVVCSVAAAHHDPGPLGFTAPAILLWAVLFCYNLGSAMWILPDQIQGPAWIPRRRPRRRGHPGESPMGSGAH
jgi:hypothetical protein